MTRLAIGRRGTVWPPRPVEVEEKVRGPADAEIFVTGNTLAIARLVCRMGLLLLLAAALAAVIGRRIRSTDGLLFVVCRSRLENRNMVSKQAQPEVSWRSIGVYRAEDCLVALRQLTVVLQNDSFWL